jgi:hypothetical protein
MLGRIFTVGGYTLLSRLTGFARDIMLAAILGAGPMADAFFVALRLPNHFRAIFAEGAFNAAFVPAYARIRQQGGADPAKLFADRVKEAAPGDSARQVDLAYRIALSRAPREDEARLAADFLGKRSLADFTHVLLNLNEFLYVR